MAQTAKSPVYILLPVYNRKALTLQFVRALRNQTYRHVQLILIDDGSTDGTAAAVCAELPDTVVISGRGAWWWAGSLQQGIDWLRKNHVPSNALVLIANDDTVPEPAFLERAADYMDQHPGTLLLARQRASALLPAEETGVYFDVRTWRHRIARHAGEINCLATRCLFVRWGDLCAIGGFRPRLLPHYFSDYEFTLRAHRRGFRLATDPDIAVRINPDATGFHEFSSLSSWGEIKKLFSKKSAANPIYASIFAILVSPPYLVPLNVLRIWWRGGSRVLGRA